MAESEPDVNVTDGDRDKGKEEVLISPMKAIGNKSRTGKDVIDMEDSEAEEIQMEQSGRCLAGIAKLFLALRVGVPTWRPWTNRNCGHGRFIYVPIVMSNFQVPASYQ